VFVDGTDKGDLSGCAEFAGKHLEVRGGFDASGNFEQLE
jgi:hypothetical protein